MLEENLSLNVLEGEDLFIYVVFVVIIKFVVHPLALLEPNKKNSLFFFSALKPKQKNAEAK